MSPGPTMKHLAWVLTLLMIVPCSRVGAQGVSKSGTTVATFLEIPVGSRAVAMGSAYVSHTGDATALYWNVAGTADLLQNEVVVSHSRWFADVNFDFAACVLPLGSFGTVGLSLTGLTMDDMKVRTVEQPEGTGEYFSAGDIAVGVSYARSLTDRFAIGMTAKYIRQSIWHEAAEGFAIDAGTIFRTDLFGGMVIGASLSNFGTPMKLAGRDTRQFGRIDDSKLGSNDRIPQDIEMDAWDLPLLFQLGVSTTVVKSENSVWTVALDALHPNNNFESINVGTEYCYNSFLYLRGGYNALFLDQAEGGVSAGVGISTSSLLGFGRVAFDYAYRDYGRLEGIHVFSVGLMF